MKNVLTFCLALIVSFSYAQEKSSDVITILNNDNKNTFILSNDISEINFMELQEIIPVDFEKKMNIEGKFSLKNINNKNLTSILSKIENTSKTTFLILEDVSESNNNTSIKKSIIITTNQDFINRLITAKIMQEGLTIDALNYGDRNIDTYRNYPEMIDVLNAKYKISSNVEMQIGDNIMPFINKPFKTEIDKTLFNSVNLLAVNF